MLSEKGYLPRKSKGFFGLKRTEPVHILGKKSRTKRAEALKNKLIHEKTVEKIKSLGEQGDSTGFIHFGLYLPYRSQEFKVWNAV